MAIAVILSSTQSLYDLPEPIYINKACEEPKKGVADIAMAHSSTEVVSKGHMTVEKLLLTWVANGCDFF